MKIGNNLMLPLRRPHIDSGILSSQPHASIFRDTNYAWRDITSTKIRSNVCFNGEGVH
jgi:hypothetical protein